jgi:hypothetical protein
MLPVARARFAFASLVAQQLPDGPIEVGRLYSPLAEAARSSARARSRPLYKPRLTTIGLQGCCMGSLALSECLALRDQATNSVQGAQIRC